MEAIKESISQMNQMFHLKLSEFEERQQRIGSPASPDVASLAAEFSVFKAFIISALRTLQTQVELIACENDKLEMYNRRKMLLLHGVGENKTDIEAVIVETVVKKLKLPQFKVEDIRHCFRLGHSVNPDKARPILFKLGDITVRNKIWAAKKELKGSGVTMSEFLTKPRHDAFMLARQRFGVGKTWTYQGLVFVLGADGVRHRISCVAELDKLGLQDALAGSSKPLAAAAMAIKEPTVAGKARRAASALKK